MLTIGKTRIPDVEVLRGVLLGRGCGEGLGPVALGLDPLDGDAVGLGVEQEQEQRLQDPGDVVPLQNLVEPGPTHGAGRRVPVTQAVQHDEERPGGEDDRGEEERRVEKERGRGVEGKREREGWMQRCREG